MSADTAPLAPAEGDEAAGYRVKRRTDEPRTASRRVAPAVVSLSTLPADRRERRLALIAVAVSASVFLLLLPFAKQRVGEAWAFIPIYQSAFLVSDLITAVLLFGQFNLLRSRALLVLAGGYLFTALMAAAHALTFPGLFAAGGLLGSGPSSTAWMYMFWHGGFPLAIIAYALLNNRPPVQAEPQAPGTLRIASSVGGVVMLVLCLTFLATSAQELLPSLMRGNQFAPAQRIAIHAVWLLCPAALAVLWRRKPHSVLDVWLMAVLCAWFFDIALSGVFNAARWDLGFYAGRIYGLLAASFVLIVLLLENSVLGAQAFGAAKTVAQPLARSDGTGTPRIAYAAIGLLLLVLIAIATHTYLAVRRELTDAATARRLAMTQLAAATQSERLDRLTDLAVSLATRVRFADLVAAGEWQGAIQILRGVPGEFPFIDRLAIFDVGGVLRADTSLERVRARNFSDRDWYEGLQRSGGKPYVSAMYRSAAPPQRDVFAVAAPIVDRDGRHTGILLLLVKIDSFFRWAEQIAFGPDAGVTIVDQHGNKAFQTDSPGGEAIVNLSANPVVARLLQGQSGVEMTVDPANGAESVYAFVPARHGWGVVTLQPAALAFAARENQLARLLVGYAIILLLCGSTVFLAWQAAAAGRRAEERLSKRLKVLSEIDQAMISEKPTEAIAAAVIQPLRELLGVARAIVNRFDLAAGEVEWVAAAGRRRTHVGPGVRYSMRMMGDVAALKRGETQIVETRALPSGPETEALLASGVEVYMVVPMIAGGELLGALSFGSESDRFAPDQVSIAREVATQLAIAMVQARLLARVRSHAAELETRVLERTAELEAVNKELSGFSYSVSHDLRAPLRAVDGYARMLEEDYAARLDEEGRRLLTVIRDSAGRMGQLIDDLLNFSRLGRQTMALQTIDVASLVREVVAEMRGDHPAIPEVRELPPVQGDRALLKQVWLNLVGNAFKYSAKRDAPWIEIGGQVEGEENIYWVRDNGAGFDMRYAAKLFGVFQRLHSQDDFSGTGVGLAIVQRVVSRHGGRVWAEGQPDAGACFYFSLPREG